MLLANCPVSSALRAIGGKWKPLILCELKNGPVRFGALRRRIPEVSQKMLTEQLRQLEVEGLVDRTIERRAILRSEYRLSAHGESMRPMLQSMAQWGATHRRARAR
jgi:DNA-binding HxlR family transcriptional regulator